MKKTITLLAFSALLYNASGQDMAATQRYFGGSQNDVIQRITKISDTQFLMVGTLDRDPNSSTGPAKMFAMVTDHQLNSFQTYRFFTSARDLGITGVVFDETTFGILGWTTKNATSGLRDEGVFIRFDEDGTILSQKVWGDNASSTNELELQSGMLDAQGDIILVGVINSPNRAVVKKLTPNGFDVWSFQYVQEGISRMQDVVQIDSHYYCSGYTTEINGDYSNMLVKLDNDGNLVWSRVFPFSNISTSSAAGNNNWRTMATTEDGGVIMEFRYNSPDDTGFPVSALLKIDADGQLIWQRKLDFGTSSNWIHSIKHGLGLNEFICVGESNALDDETSAMVFSFNDSPSGPIPNWINLFPGEGYARFTDLESFDDGLNKGYILVGETEYYSDNGRDSWIVRTDPFGGGWENDECWISGLPFTFGQLQMTSELSSATLTPWNIVGQQDFTTDQPIVNVFHNDGLCLPMTFETNVEEQGAFGDDMLVFPNPSSGEVYIRSEQFVNQRVLIEVFNVSGQTVLRQNDHSLDARMPISLRHCPPGMYFIQISTPQGVLSRQKILIR